MSTAPLSHHEILPLVEPLVEPFTHAGRSLDHVFIYQPDTSDPDKHATSERDATSAERRPERIDFICNQV